MQSTGIKKRALCIGIEYKDHQDVSKVIGAHADARRLAKVLKNKFAYEVEVMLDDGVGPYQPTKDNIYAAIQRLVKGARAEDRFFFHFSGHGTQIENMDGTERDGLDEVILPVNCKINPDYSNNKHHRNYWFEDSRIIDDELNAWFLPVLPSGCLLTVLIDACHSGTALDLKYTYSYGQILPECGVGCESPATEKFPNSPVLPVTERSISGPTRDHLQSNTFPGHTPGVRECSGDDRRCRSLMIRRVTDYPQQSHQEGPVVVFWAPCADANIAYGSSNGGLMVNMFIDHLCRIRGNPPTHRELLCSLHHQLRTKCKAINYMHPESLIESQEPQFGTNMFPLIDQPMVL